MTRPQDPRRASATEMGEWECAEQEVPDVTGCGPSRVCVYVSSMSCDFGHGYDS